MPDSPKDELAVAARDRTSRVEDFYSEVTSKLCGHPFEPEDFEFHRLLDEISSDEDEAGRGLLTVVVVHKDGDMLPGDGFFELAERRGRQVDDRLTFWAEEAKRVWDHWKV